MVIQSTTRRLQGASELTGNHLPDILTHFLLLATKFVDSNPFCGGGINIPRTMD